MAKPFKSEFDLMAEAYGTINYDKQQLINEDKAGRRVIGYPPQLVSEDFEDFSEGSDTEDTDTVTVQLELDKDTAKKLHVDLMDVVDSEVEDEVASEEPVEGEEPVEDAEGTPHIQAVTAAIDELAETLQGDEKLAVYEDLRDYLTARLSHAEDNESFAKIDQDASNGLGKAELVEIYGADVVEAYIKDGVAKGKFEGGIEDGEHAEDESPFPTADHDAPEGGIGSRSKDEAEKVDYGPSGEGKPVHPDEAAESAPGMNSRIDGMIDRDALGAAQAALQNILADLHANGEEIEADDVAAFIASTLS